MAWNIRRMTSSRAPLEPVTPNERQKDRPDGEPGKAEVVHLHRPNMSPMRPTVTTTAADTSI